MPFHRLPSVGDLPFVHKIDVQQGNVITQEMVAQLRKGMDKKKVQFIMGTPIILDTFNNTRWDYLYTFQHRGGEIERRRVTLVFADDKLDRITGDVTAAAGEIEVELHKDTTVDVPKTGGRGMMARIKDTIPFTGDKEAKDDKSGKDKPATADAKSGDKPDDKSAPTTKLATADKPTGVEVPEDPKAEKALPAPVENPYENIQSAPGEGVVVPPDAPRLRHKRGFGSRFLGVFGLGEGDYVHPTPPEKPQEPLVKRPEPEDE
jgi:outer membrane protein assembly factor BamE